MIYLFTSNEESFKHYLYDNVDGYIIMYCTDKYNSYKWLWSENYNIYMSNKVCNIELMFDLPDELVIGPPTPNDGDLHKALYHSIEKIIFENI